MWREVIEVFSAVLVSMGGLELVKWVANRRANSRKAEAEADRARADVGGDYITMYERVMTTQAGQVESLMRQVNEHTNTIIGMNTAMIGLKNEVADLRVSLTVERRYHCEVRGCPDRVPPNEYMAPAGAPRAGLETAEGHDGQECAEN